MKTNVSLPHCLSLSLGIKILEITITVVCQVEDIIMPLTSKTLAHLKSNVDDVIFD